MRTIILLVIAFLIWCFSAFSHLVESLYSTHLYRWFAATLRLITRWLPFSLGDILYAIAALWLLKSIVKLVILLFNRRWNKASFLAGLQRNINRLLRIYIIFNLFWGLNYDRLGIAYQLKIQPARYDTATLKQLTAELIEKVNNCRLQIEQQKLVYPAHSEIFKSAIEAYGQTKPQFPFLEYRNASVKRSLYGKLGNYMGYLGYYNPFSGEAQVNVEVPDFLQPYVTCHEIAHQLGYASESEANFVGYLAAKNSTSKLFNYSVYFDLFNYANGELFYRDSLAARDNYRRLDTLVKLDIKAYRKYLKAYKNPVEPIIRIFYSNYLKANNQPKGIESYNEVVAWLISYRQKYGAI